MPMIQRKKGFSLIESLILILILALVIGGILEVSAYTTRLQLAARKGIDSYLAAASWFAALESSSSDDIRSGAAFTTASNAIGGAAGYISSPDTTESSGIITVTVRLITGANDVKTVSRSYNTYGNYTVSDDKGKEP